MHLNVSEAARRLGAKPRDISDLYYKRVLRDDICPVVGGRRQIPETYLDIIAMELRRRGLLKATRRSRSDGASKKREVTP